MDLLRVTVFTQKGWTNINLTEHGEQVAANGKLKHSDLEKEYGGKLASTTVEVLNSFGWRRIYDGQT